MMDMRIAGVRDVPKRDLSEDGGMLYITVNASVRFRLGSG